LPVVHLAFIAVLGLLMAFVIPSGKMFMDAKILLGECRSKWADIHRMADEALSARQCRTSPPHGSRNRLQDGL